MFCPLFKVCFISGACLVYLCAVGETGCGSLSKCGKEPPLDYKLKLCPQDAIYLCFKLTGCALSSGAIHNSIDPTFPMAKSCAAGEGIYYIHQGQTSFLFLNLYMLKEMICN